MPPPSPPRRRARSPLAVLAVLAGLAAGAAARAEPAIWRVRQGQSTVWLVGTVHLTSPGETWRSPSLTRIEHDADDLTLEVADPADPAASQRALAELGTDPDGRLSATLDPKTALRLEAFLISQGLAPGALDYRRPWSAALSVSLLPMIKAGFDPAAGVDLTLRADFVRENKPVRGLETAMSQLRLLADLPSATQVRLVADALDDADKGPEQFHALEEAWRDGDLARLATMLDEDLRRDYPDVYDALVVRRNQRFAVGVVLLLQQPGRHLLAVGAAHLVGPHSVLADLEEMGVRVERQ